MFEDETTILQPADFPDYYVDNHHPEDYISTKEPVQELIYHHMPDHNRLIVRMSFKISSKNFIPVTFICDTGAPSFIYINSVTRRLIKSIILKDEIDNEYLKINEKRMGIKPSPTNHPDVNIIGLRALSQFQLFLNADEFSFNNLPDYF